MQWSFLTAFVSGSGAAAAIGMINSIGNLAGVVSPVLIGWLKDRTQSTDLGMYVIAGCALVSAIVALSFPARLVNK
jgi:nitrate/nitrite transporter NarK